MKQKLNRRDFLRRGGLFSGGTLLASSGLSYQATQRLLRRLELMSEHGVDPDSAQYDYSSGVKNIDPNLLTKFVDPLPIPEVARPQNYRSSPDGSGAQIPYYRVEMQQFTAKVHRDLKPTVLWGYGSSSPGKTFDVRSGHGMFVEWANKLPNTHLLPIDHGIHGAERDKPDVRVVVHVHGAKVRPESDGYPEHWYRSGRSALYHYPNQQDAAMLWYHDHALGITRLNVYAGLFGAFIIRDGIEDELNLPKGAYEIPLIICDRLLNVTGRLYYPTSPVPGGTWVPEVSGNAILVNGKLYPYLEVEPRKYRFRVANVSNGRTLHFWLPNYRPFYQVGTDQGLLAAPVSLTSVVLGPAERADLIIDFTGDRGREFSLFCDSTEILQFRVSTASSRDDSLLPAALRPVSRLSEQSAVQTRYLTLNDYMDGNRVTCRMLLNKTHWSMPVTERPTIDTIEIWYLINLTTDSHPIHLHLVRFQILDFRRFERPFDLAAFEPAKVLEYTGQPFPPEPNESGWKDTVRVPPSGVARIIVHFDGFVGRYVWHCHILEHEDNEMMRPFEVLPAS